MAIANETSQVFKFATAGDTTADDTPVKVQTLIFFGGSGASAVTIVEYGKPTGGIEIKLNALTNDMKSVSFPKGLIMRGIESDALSGTGAILYVVTE